jgi:hypothetical protein
MKCRYSPLYAARFSRGGGVDQPVLVESGLPYLCSCATSVVPELGGKGERKNPRSGRRRHLLDPRTPSSRIIVATPVTARHLA